VGRGLCVYVMLLVLGNAALSQMDCAVVPLYWCSVHPVTSPQTSASEKLIFTQLVKKSALWNLNINYSHVPASGTCPGPHKFILHPSTLISLKSNFILFTHFVAVMLYLCIQITCRLNLY